MKNVGDVPLSEARRSRFEVVLFDLDDTLSDFESAQRVALPALLQAHGVEDPDVHLPTFKEVAGPLWRDLESGRLTLETLNDERFRLLVERAGLDLDPTVLAPDYLDWLSRSGELWPGAIELLDALHGDVRLGLITNGYSEVQRPRLERFGLDGYFESVVVSSEIGHAKPSPKFFDAAFADLDHPDPATVLVVGDSLTSDIAGAEAAGCVTCWFNPNGRVAPSSPRIDHSAQTLAEVEHIVFHG